MKIGIRADGGSKIGMGHIIRTLALAKELLKYNNEVLYICRAKCSNIDFFALFNKNIITITNNNVKAYEELIGNEYIKGIKKVLSEGFRVNLVRESNLIEDLKKVEADTLITDSYEVDADYFNKTKDIFPQTVYIDDMNLHYFNVSILINQNINAEDFSYNANEDTRLMLGTKYVMLRDEFKHMAVRYISEKVRDVMLTVGGADPYHITERILAWVKNLKYNFHVVIGPSFDNNNIKDFECDKIKLYYNADMCEIMKKCDVAISACGSTLYELCRVGTPTLGIVLADNQVGVANKFHEIGVINNLGWYKNLTKDKLIKELSFLECYERRREISYNMIKLVDGKGPKRIAKELKTVSILN
ncbi:UDP-2,4-diacetamido-2,4,6-trideoxy-beta-L-altropyranose hydrolase [Clostridium sp. OS1-26]|uniref:UDP-2,4-diacetamido-2,4, 6-trideoxy-beta-L-altropyranose hydrolase n=1 Tax=Clostridium sp. OS1-26 TaxID=3070681 RepID=UPI0027E06268|nr:UDP-2,4-diacetamido-2,4,6-trideoxy-beta-L-altropyranose hydrolase [Clostridium sp. OS1-26]WML37706.1 UDP-2,4-diacetamido-2,4,6-trideoxy-beta-L-altropyranose hydrolase [Clostridium sp. OS1-26]